MSEAALRRERRREEPSAYTVIEKVAHACADAKGEDLLVLDVSGIFDMADYFVFVSGRSDRQVQGISNKVIEALEQTGVGPLAVEGLELGHWVLIDAGDVVVHVFYGPVRGYYGIENLWAKAKPLQIDPQSGKLVKAAG